MSVKTFLEQMKSKCESKAVDMARLELTVWDTSHETELKNNFGFTDTKLAARKKELIKKAQ